jgi:hypothetical protein
MMPCQGAVYSSASSSQLCCPSTAESPDHKHLSIIPSLLPVKCTSEEILHVWIESFPLRPMVCNSYHQHYVKGTGARDSHERH